MSFYNHRVESTSGQRGNALFLILIAVALFAALSYAITQSGRGGGTVDRETVVITAGQVVEQPAAVRTAVTRMIITGTSAAAVKFDTTATVGVFAADGGGATDLPPPGAACSSAPCTAWTYFDVANAGSYIKGVGTDADTGVDAIAYLPDVTGSVCAQIQKGLGLDHTQSDLDAAKQATAAFTGATGSYASAGSATTIVSSDASLNGQAFSCWENATTANYAYYHALIEQ